MQLLKPDTEEMMAAAKRYQGQGNAEAAKMERNKLKNVRKIHGVYPLIGMVNIAQMPMHMVYISMTNRLAYNFEVNPAILNEGMLWFKDLSQPDPTGILPILGGIVSLMNFLTTRTAGSDSRFRKFRKFIIVMPLLAIPIQMTFPVAFNVYWLTTSSIQLAVMAMFRSDRFRGYMGIPEYLPGTKLERINTKKAAVSIDN